MCGIVDPNTLAIGLGEARAEQSNGAANDVKTDSGVFDNGDQSVRSAACSGVRPHVR
jgi:hypothetical protein